MPEILFDSISTPESYVPGLVICILQVILLRLDLRSTEVQRQTIALSSPNEASEQSSQSIQVGSASAEESNREVEEFFRSIVSLLRSQDLVSNIKAFASRFTQLVRRPEQLAPLVLDFWSLSLSIVWSGGKLGPDLLYPFSSLKKHKSGRLARLLLEHSRRLQQRNLRVAASLQEGIDPPCVVVLDLDEVPQDIVKSGYSVPVDFFGLVILMIFLETLLTLGLYIFAPIDASPLGDWVGGWFNRFFGDEVGAWISYLVSTCAGIAFNWIPLPCFIFTLSVYAILRGNGVLALVRRSATPGPGCAVLLDRDFTLILVGTQNVIEAIAEHSFSISHPVSWKFHQRGWQLVQCLCYEALEASCQGVIFVILAGCWLLLNPSSLLLASVPLVPTVIVSIMSACTHSARNLNYMGQRGELTHGGMSKELIIATTRSLFRIAPAFLLILIYELVVAKDTLLRSVFHPTILLHHIPNIFLAILLVSSRNYQIQTAKLLDVLGQPPVRRWEFDTLAAAATFQCLVVCRGIPRPVKTIDVLTLLDTFVSDQTDVWVVWKARVADRIAHEIDISFAPTLPSFGDQRQEHLKELLDQAQIGYDSFRRFYDWHVPLHSTIAL